MKNTIQTYASLVAVIAFLALLATFAWTLADFRSNVERWARRDVRLRAQLAADSLRTPLATQDIRRIGEIGQALKDAHGLLLTVYSPQGGVFYRVAARVESDISEVASSGEYQVELGRSKEEVFLPFYEALVGFVLAALVGVVGMFAVFFALYRQRVRIRELARLEQFRRNFIADVSHEIKTPLTGILGAVDMLEDDSSPLVGMIRSSAKRLNRLVQSILDLARLEREGDAIRRERVDLARLLDDLVAEFRPRAESSGVSLTRVGERELFVSCDSQLIAQAVGNLVENAIRYAHSPTVVVSLADDGETAGIAVEDHGVGIAAEHREHVFERFYRIDAARTAEAGGAGLGLAIVRRIARLHGGEVGCEAVRPCGVRFTLRVSVR